MHPWGLASPTSRKAVALEAIQQRGPGRWRTLRPPIPMRGSRNISVESGIRWIVWNRDHPGFLNPREGMDYPCVPDLALASGTPDVIRRSRILLSRTRGRAGSYRLSDVPSADLTEWHTGTSETEFPWRTLAACLMRTPHQPTALGPGTKPGREGTARLCGRA